MTRVATGLLAFAGAAGLGAVLRQRTTGDRARWTRTNHAGREVDLLGGVAVAGGSALGALATGGREGSGALLVVTAAGALGAHDDADTDSRSKGLRGHVRALGQGEVTTGLLKLLGISGAALAAATVVTGAGERSREGGAAARAADVLLSGVQIAATANLVNLFDLRPGRALKVAGLLAVPAALAGGPGAPLATATLGAVAGGWESDLRAETMLGDAGANALGALVGTAGALLPWRRARLAGTAAVVGLVLLSEKVSFTRVIERTPALRRLDDWGRTG